MFKMLAFIEMIAGVSAVFVAFLGSESGLRGDEALAKIQFKLPGWRWMPYVIIAFLALVAVLMCFSPSYRIALVAGVVWLAVLFAAYALTQRTGR